MSGHQDATSCCSGIQLKAILSLQMFQVVPARSCTVYEKLLEGHAQQTGMDTPVAQVGWAGEEGGSWWLTVGICRFEVHVCFQFQAVWRPKESMESSSYHRFSVKSF